MDNKAVIAENTEKKNKIKKNVTKSTNVRISIKTKMLLGFLPIVVLVITTILLLVYFNTSNIILNKSKTILKTNAQSVVHEVSTWMNRTITALEVERDVLEYFPMNEQDELNYIKHTVDQYDAFPAGIYVALKEDGSLIHASFVPGSDYNVYEKPWYKDGLNSEEFVFGSVYFDEDSQAYVVGASGVLKDKTGKVRGVAAADIYLKAISQIVEKVEIEKTGGMFLIDARTNTLIGHKDANIIGTTLDSQENKMYSYIQSLVDSNTTGIQTYKEKNGNQIFLDVVNVPNSDWVAVAYVPENEIMSDLNILTQYIVLLAAAAIIILFVLITILIRFSIMKPVKQLDSVARRIADGNLNETIAYHSADEFGELADSFNRTVQRLRSYIDYINEISFILDEISKGNLEFELKLDYVGEFSKVKEALLHISESLNNILGKISTASVYLSDGSEQVSNGAQSLSEGATEQASAIEELAATIDEMSSHIQKTASNAQEAKEKAMVAGSGLVASDQKMQEMIEAMEQISQKSAEIGKIIKTIEDISYQTNILALNAAIEAARAGEAGGSFAVVAEQVRNLAGKSSEAAKNITALIEDTTCSVKYGTDTADSAATYIVTVVEQAKEVTLLVEKIAQASQEQANSVIQITQGTDQISGVVQNNSATAQQSAAASEELSAQAQLLKQLVEQFKLKE